MTDSRERVIDFKAGARDRPDHVQPFQIEGMDVRGRIVRLGQAADESVLAHAYPAPLARLMGEFLALTAMLGSIFKSEGLLTVQAKAAGDAPVNFIVADYATPGDLRGYADFDAEALAELSETSGLDELIGRGGYLALTIEQGRRQERYQGIVELEGESLAESAVSYFERSEQTPTTLRLAAGRSTADGAWRAGGIMVQHLAGATRERPERHRHLEVIDSHEEENRTRAATLMNSVRDTELLDPGLPLNDLLYRLFHEEGVRVFEPVAIGHRCRCSKDRTRALLDRFPKAELAEMVVDGEIVATCQFCNARYRFDPAEVGDE
mgnify:CR=1 FL=1